MLSDNDRRVLAEIERNLEEDSRLRRSFRRAAVRRVIWIRRLWLAVLLTSLVLMLGLAALDMADAALESALLAAVAWTGLRCTRSRSDGGVGLGPIPDRRG